MTLATGQSNGGTGLTLSIAEGNPNPANGPLSDITGVTLRGSDGYAMSNYWTTGVFLSGVSNVNLTDISIAGAGGAAYSTNGTGLVISGSSEAIPVAFNITRATINYVGTGISIGPFAEGIAIAGCNFTGDETGLYAYVPPGITGSGNSMLYVCGGNQFNCSTAAINVQAVIEGLLVSGNMIIMPGGALGVQIGVAAPFSITNNQFISSDANATGQNGIVIQGYDSGAGLISGNNFYSLNPTRSGSRRARRTSMSSPMRMVEAHFATTARETRSAADRNEGQRVGKRPDHVVAPNVCLAPPRSDLRVDRCAV